MKQKTLSVLLVLAMLFGMVPTVAFATGDIADQTALQAALTAGGTVTLTQDITTTSTLTVSTTVTLDLAGYDITRSTSADTNFSVIEVDGSGITFTLKDTGTGTSYGYWSGSTYTITETQPEDMTDVDTLTGGIIKNGYTGSSSAGGGVTVSKGTFLMEGGNIAGNVNENTGNGGGGVYVAGTGIFNMTGGTIAGNYASKNNGGGVLVMTSGTFNMSGGKITKNITAKYGGGIYSAGTLSISNGAEISSNEAGYSGGGITVDRGTATMSGATTSIINNKATGEGKGGGVFLHYAGDVNSFTMESGIISGNTAATNGGGVYVNGFSSKTTTFTMNGGTISGNESTGNSSNSGTYGGGGVYVAGYGTFDMNGGTIGGTTTADANTAVCSGGGLFVLSGGVATIDDSSIMGNSATVNGGGIYNAGTLSMGTATISKNSGGSGAGLMAGGTVTMVGGSITGNTTTGSGGGVYLSGTFKVSGAVAISDNTKSDASNNVYLPTDKSISVTDDLTGSSIGVNTQTAPADNAPVTVAVESDYTLDDDDKGVFFKDSSVAENVKIIRDETSNTIQLYVAHVHTWVYAQGQTNETDDATKITATCSSGTCEDTSTTATLQIVAPTGGTDGSYTYTGSAIVATIDDDDNNAIQGDAEIVYYAYDNTESKYSEDAMTTTPTDVGTYKAEITLGEDGNTATAYVTYTIAPATVKVAWENTDDCKYTGTVLEDYPTATYTPLGTGATAIDLAVTIETGKTFQNVAVYTFTAAFNDGDTTSSNYTLDSDTTTQTVSITKAGSQGVVTDDDEEETDVYTVNGDTITYGDKVQIQYTPELKATIQGIDNETDAEFETVELWYGEKKIGLVTNLTNVVENNKVVIEFIVNSTNFATAADFDGSTSRTFTIKWGGDDNLSACTTDISLILKKAALTATVDTADSTSTKVYDGTTAFEDVKLIVSDEVLDETITATATGTSASANVSASTAFTATTTTLVGTTKDYYTVVTSGNVAITAAPITVAWTGTSDVYDDVDGATATLVGVVGEEDVSVSIEYTDANGTKYTDETITDAPAGTYTATATVTGGDKDNYDVSNLTTTVTISKAPVTFGIGEDGTVSATAPSDFTNFTVTYTDADGKPVDVEDMVTGESCDHQ